MKKGLRRVWRAVCGALPFESRPYEEGIKTVRNDIQRFLRLRLNRDLMKKGLRRVWRAVCGALPFESRPYEEGIKTRFGTVVFEMKLFESRPYEEGIKTKPYSDTLKGSKV